jgi:alpha-amylase/alpha-mannosidase (GH57 family)
VITLNFLWHMHQPDYRHPQGGMHTMPWVRLHAVKGYVDLLHVLERYEQAHCVVNFSGILLEQLAGLLAGEQDYYAGLSIKPAEALTADERKFVLQNFFSMNRHTLIRPHQRFYELLSKKEHLLKVGDLDEAAGRFSTQELTDLAVWFNLGWIGFAGQKRQDVRELILKGREYSNSDQREVQAIHRELMAEVIPGYKALSDAGRIELTFTPYHHPILPLIIDLAKEGCKNDLDPLPEFRFAPDAQEHVRRGIELYQNAFGKAPRGAWPAEGSVSDAALEVFSHAGIEWVATDQQNLPGKEQRPYGHATPWSWERDGSKVVVFFRDTRLADNIGFEYASWHPSLAGNHMIDMAVALAKQSGQPNPVITVALDGENPWEAYADGGEGFLCAMFERTAADQQLVCSTPSQIIAEAKFPVLDHIHAGSWIGGNFNIWSRHPETRIAWRRLAQARHDLMDVCAGQVREHLLAAEGSDWFWWYGDDFVSDHAAKFDELFRFRLIAAYECAHRLVPEALYAPIHSERVPELAGELQALIKPVIDGRETTFFEWRGAVKVKANHAQSSMARASADSGVQALWYGFSDSALYLRLDLSDEFVDTLRHAGGNIVVCISQGGVEFCRRYECAQGLKGANAKGDCALDVFVELGMELAETALQRGALAYLWVEIACSTGQTDRFPAAGRIPLRVISDDFSARHWFI